MLTRKTLCVLIATLMLFQPKLPALAQDSIAPSADTYTDLNQPDTNFGTDDNLFLFASNMFGCTATSYIWLKFEVPDTGSSIDGASLAMSLNAIGSGPADLELLDSSDVSWIETAITWNTQPVPGTTTLARATNAAPGSNVVFTGSCLATYLDSHQGETVTLLVRADCDGEPLNVAPVTAMGIAAKENETGPGISIVVGPTAVQAADLTGSSNISVELMLPLLAAAAIVYLSLRTRRRSNPQSWL